MGIGVKRICQTCGSKFYDLDKKPIKCPKCNAVFDPEVVLKPKRGRKKASAAEDQHEEIEIAIDDVAIEEVDEDEVAEELDDDLRDEMDLDEDEEKRGKKGDKIMVDLEDDADDIIESDTGDSDKE